MIYLNDSLGLIQVPAWGPDDKKLEKSDEMRYNRYHKIVHCLSLRKRKNMRYDEDLLVDDSPHEEEVDISGIIASAEAKKQQVERRRRIEDIFSDKELKKIYGDPLLE